MTTAEMTERASKLAADEAQSIADEAERMLESSMSTDEIAASFGVEYASMLRRLRRHGYGVLVARLSRRRMNEASVRLGRTVANGRHTA